MITDEQYKAGTLLKSGDSLALLVKRDGKMHMLWLDPDDFMFMVSTSAISKQEIEDYTYVHTLDKSFCALLHKDFGIE
jgi:hypothetical protein